MLINNFYNILIINILFLYDNNIDNINYIYIDNKIDNIIDNNWWKNLWSDWESIMYYVFAFFHLNQTFFFSRN